MTRVLLVRHGEADVTGRVLVGRAAGVHLNARGVEQARRVARRLDGVRVAALWSSPLERTCETAAPLAWRQSLDVTIVESLLELDFGDWQGRSIEELEPDPDWQAYNEFRSLHRTPNGESLIEVQVRMARTLEAIGDCHPDATVVAVSHGDPIRALLAHALGIPLDLFGRLTVQPGSISAIDLGPGGPQVRCLNDLDGGAYLRI